jgi:alpha-ketoglutarate-dependent 2,4-dichlorophenoxyacetate dioxygenase
MKREATTMAISTQELHPGFAAEANFLDLSRPLHADTIAAIDATIQHYPVLVFRDQHLTDSQLHDFALRFGPLEAGRSAAHPGRRRLAIPQIGDIANLDADNNVRALTDRRRLDSLGNRLWHTDAAYMPVPVVLGLLHAVALPPPSPFGNGETEFADMRAAYDALPSATKAAVDPLIAEHDVFWSRAQIGFTAFPPGEREQYPPSRQRLVRRHPHTGRESLYLSAHASYITGWPGRRRAPAAVRSEHSRNTALFRLQSHLARRRPCHLGQSLDHASRPPARRSQTPRPAPGNTHSMPDRL